MGTHGRALVKFQFLNWAVTMVFCLNNNSLNYTFVLCVFLCICFILQWRLKKGKNNLSSYFKFIFPFSWKEFLFLACHKLAWWVPSLWPSIENPFPGGNIDRFSPLKIFLQEELKINNLVFSLLLDEEISSRETFLNNYLARKQEEKVNTVFDICVSAVSDQLLPLDKSPHSCLAPSFFLHSFSNVCVPWLPVWDF